MPGPGSDRWLWNDVFGFQTSLNEGALFGMGQGMVVAVRRPFGGRGRGASSTGCSSPAPPATWLLTVALGCVTAGILGNLYDRLGLPGLRGTIPTPLHRAGEPVYAVRDWILVMIGPWPWPNFNVADSCWSAGRPCWSGTPSR